MNRIMNNTIHIETCKYRPRCMAMIYSVDLDINTSAKFHLQRDAESILIHPVVDTLDIFQIENFMWEIISELNS